MIEILTTSIFYLEFKESNDNDNEMTFCYFSCLGGTVFSPRLWQFCRPKQLLTLASLGLIDRYTNYSFAQSPVELIYGTIESI